MGSRKWLTSRLARVVVIAAGVLACWLVVTQVEATTGKKVKAANVKGIAVDTQGRPIVGATVYFVDSTLVNTSEISPAGVLAGTTDGFDEPLEDIISKADVAKTLPQAKTNSKGQFSVKKLNGQATYFPFVVPDPEKDTDHLPGGDISRAAFAPKSVGKGGLKIQVSWKAPADATYIGSTACYACHSDIASNKGHAHSLALRVPGQLQPNQAAGTHASQVNYFTDQFVLATDYNKPVTSTDKIKVLNFTTPITSGSTISWLVVESDHTVTSPSPTPYIQMFLWKKATGEHYITLYNYSAKAADPKNPLHLQLGMVKGGLMGNSYMLVNIPGRKGLYRFLGYKGYPGASQGKSTYYDRAKHPYSFTVTDWLDLGADKKIGGTDDRLGKFPAAVSATGAPNNWEASCGYCHFTGFQQSAPDPVTGEILAQTVADPNGVDVYGTGVKQEFMIGCEVCHGKGSRHRDEALKDTSGTTTPAATSGAKTPRTPRTKTPENFKGKFIVNPKLLCNDRSSLICGRCHRAADGYKNANDFTKADNFPAPGISRADFLANYVDPAKRGPALSSYWPDMKHPKSGKNYPDWLSAKHSHNQRYLVGCDDCHSGHFADAEAPRSLLYAPESDSPLCQRCHSKEVSEHAKEMTGNAMTGSTLECIQCHMAKTALEGAGKPGLLLGTPDGKTDGTSSDANIMYWEADVPSHVFDMPNKFTVGVAGVKPGSAMPVPYVYSCGTCHDATKLQFQGSN